MVLCVVGAVCQFVRPSPTATLELAIGALVLTSIILIQYSTVIQVIVALYPSYRTYLYSLATLATRVVEYKLV